MERNRALWRRYSRLGDSVILFSNILSNVPDCKINLYFWKRSVTDLWLQLAHLLDSEERVTLIEDLAPAGTKPLAKFTSIVSDFKYYAKLNKNRLKPNFDQIKKIKIILKQILHTRSC